jgi:DegV family protein with EDD domain
MRFGIFIDAACDLPSAFIAANPVHVLPIPVRVDDKLFSDTRDEGATRRFYQRVLAGAVVDAETQPYSEAQLEKLFLDKLVLRFDYVICLVISRAESPLFERVQKASFQILTKYRAVRAQAGIEGPFAMRAFDSESVFAAQGVQVQELVRLIRAGTPVTRVLKRIEEIVPQTYGYMVPADLRYIEARARRRGGRNGGRLRGAVGNALDLKRIVRSFRGQSDSVAKVRHFGAACDRVFANVAREIARGLLAPFVNLSYGGDWTPITQRAAYAAMAKAAEARGVQVSWSHLSMAAGVNVGPGTLTVGIVAQPHEFH